MAVSKINIQKINRKDGFDTFDALRIARLDEFDNQKVSAVIKVLVDTVNQLIDDNATLKQLLAVRKVKTKGGGKKA